MPSLPFILASASPTRVKLLATIGITPDKIIPADIDESELPRELPRLAAIRLAKSKAEKVSLEIRDGYIVAADTIAALGRRSLPKATDDNLVRECLELLSGRSHTLYTGLTIIKKLEGQIINTRQKIVETKVKVKRLTAKEIERYIKSGEGLNKAGGYAIHGLFQSYIQFVSGSFSNVAGLPIHELYKALDSLGYYSSGESILHTKIA